MKFQILSINGDAKINLFNHLSLNLYSFMITLFYDSYIYIHYCSIMNINMKMMCAE